MWRAVGTEWKSPGAIQQCRWASRRYFRTLHLINRPAFALIESKEKKNVWNSRKNDIACRFEFFAIARRKLEPPHPRSFCLTYFVRQLLRAFPINLNASAIRFNFSAWNFVLHFYMEFYFEVSYFQQLPTVPALINNCRRATRCVCRPFNKNLPSHWNDSKEV